MLSRILELECPRSVIFLEQSIFLHFIATFSKGDSPVLLGSNREAGEEEVQSCISSCY